MNKISKKIMCAVGLGLLAQGAVNSVLAADTVIPPGVPEPGLIIWGQVLNADNPKQSAAVGSMSWNVDGDGKSTMFVDHTPAVRIFQKGGDWYYVLQVPFDTRTLGSGAGAVKLAEPENSYELKSSTSKFTLTPTVNGELANIYKVDGTSSSQNSVTGPSGSNKGVVIRVDITAKASSSTTTYESWIKQYFGDPSDVRAAKDADPDGDGVNNWNEYLAGTNPLDKEDYLHIISFYKDDGQVEMSWKTAADMKYVVEVSENPDGPFTAVDNNVVVGDGSVKKQSDNPKGTKKYYRIRLISERGE